MEYINDDYGKWSVRNGKKYGLVEPSPEYLIKNTPKEPTQEELNQQIINELNTTNDSLVRLIEDMALKLEEISDFKIPQVKKELIEERKEKRKQIT